LKKRVAVAGIAIMVILVGVVAWIFYLNPCSDVFPCHDSPITAATEERDVLRRSKDLYERLSAQAKTYPAERAPEPLRVHISDFNATLTASGPIDPGHLGYAQIWYEVYHEHHRGTRTVYMRVVWKSGSVLQKFPLSEF
jgi:hypothetical protein